MRQYRLILINGGVINIEYPDKTAADEETIEEIWDELLNHFQTQQIWNCGNWPGLEATFGNEKLEYIDFHKVVGIY